jgi:exosortase A
MTVVSQNASIRSSRAKSRGVSDEAVRAPLEHARDEPASWWRSHLLALIVAATVILLLFHRDAAHMVSIWWNSSTFNHCLLIPPIIGWLVWQRRGELSQLVPQAWAPGLVLVGLGGLGWLLGEAGGVSLARHAGLVLMLQGAVIACLGKAVARGLAFPLSYALFLIPVGEEIVPFMQTITAEMCMALLALAGVPAHIEGVFISTPAGLFEVAEACAGVKFLIAMVAYGALVANVCFRSWTRRAAFMAVSVAVPILANGLRAFGTIYVAEWTGIEAAAGFDHIFYGWIFFGIVIALIMGIGWRFFDRGVGEPWFDPRVLQPVPPAPLPGRSLGIAAGAVSLAALPLAWVSLVAASGTQAAPADIRLPDVPGWTRVAASGRPWQPHFAGADVIRMARYRNASGQEVDLAVAVFARQQEGRELVAFGQGAVVPGGAWSWTADAPPPPNGRAERIVSYGDVREVLSFYRVGNLTTGSRMAVKIETMRTRLLGGPQRAVAVLVSAPAPAAGVSPRSAIGSFLAALGPIDRLSDEAARP